MPKEKAPKANIDHLKREIDESIAIWKKNLEKSPDELKSGQEQVREAIRETNVGIERNQSSRLGLRDPDARARTRVAIQEMSAVPQFLTEATPSTLGAALGAGAGALVGGPIAPATIPIGAAAGGFLGELLSQEAGITPQSDVSLAVSAAAPALGPVAGGIGKGIRKGTGALIRNFPSVRQAAGQIAKQDAEKVIETLGGEVFHKLGMAQTLDEAEAVIKQYGPFGTTVSKNMFGNTASAIQSLPKNSQVKAIMAENPPGKLSDILAARSALVETAVRGSEVDRKAAKEILNAVDRDLDNVLTVQPGRGMVRQVQQAVKRARSEIAIQDMDQAAMRFSKPVEGSEDLIEMNITQFRKWFFDKTNPRSKSFDRDFADGIGPVAGDINKALAKLENTVAKGKMGGPGSLIIQGRMALGGAMVGGALLGPVGAGAGALAATTVPRGFVRALASKRGQVLMKTMTRIGEGQIPHKRWAVIMEGAAQSFESSRRQLFEDER